MAGTIASIQVSKIDMKIRLPIIFLILISIGFLVMGFRGKYSGKLLYQNDLSTVVGGPFEASNSTSRYALVKSIVDNKSFFLSEELARFSSPDLVYDSGRFSSIFLPGVSFLAVPFYYLGNKFGIPQLTTYLLNPILGIICLILLYKVGEKLGATRIASILGAFLFLFATNALPYTQTLTQHLPTAALLLGAILNSFYPRTWLNNIVLGIIIGYAVFIDIPNLFIFFPLLIFVIWKHFDLKNTSSEYIIDLKHNILGLLIGVLPIVVAFGLYNKAITGSYTSIGQSIGRTNYEDARIAPDPSVIQVEESIFERKAPLDTRKAVQGIYILLFSNERGIFYYQPIIIIGLIGLILLYKQVKYRGFVVMLTSTIIFNLLVYIFFGDPWGGWSYGPRYLIPTTAILSVCFATTFSILKKNIIFNLFALIIMLYSIYVNVLGVITTNSIPPMQEAIALITPIPYTYQYNLNLLKTNNISSLFYDVYIDNNINPTNYFYIYLSLVSAAGICILISNYKEIK